MIGSSYILLNKRQIAGANGLAMEAVPKMEAVRGIMVEALALVVLVEEVTAFVGVVEEDPIIGMAFGTLQRSQLQLHSHTNNISDLTATMHVSRPSDFSSPHSALNVMGLPFVLDP